MTRSFTLTGTADALAYTIDGIAGMNPTLTLTRGKTYEFTVTSVQHPLRLRTTPGGTDFAVGVSGTASATSWWMVPCGAPTTMYYQCQFHPAMLGMIALVDQSALRMLHGGNDR